ncbi:hypothetical protein HPB51_007813 [Rhipicephalus microplus]|uniref:Tick transposon n=1 Tax=Rhipicephalus microplus TaxID=6941 RepID=A0A9J6EZG4_RHIMP|nr:hypothetical protein HPB51_007813 [Rhipicephalus microplus]
MYGLPYHPVNRTQIIKLDRLLNEAKRMVTGLPRYTRLDALKSCSKLNNLTELVDMHIHTQETRLRATNAGRYTLMLLGYDINTLPMLPNKTPPWEITVLTDGKPLPLNMDPNQRARRLNYAKRHARATSSLPMTERVVYTDAALPADGTSNTCYATAWGDTPPPVTGLCSTCNCRADLNHLCWECPVYNPPRLRALATIKRGPWPSSLRTWACPEPSPPDRAIEFWRALIMFLQDPAAPPVGDRLRDSHKIQAIQAAPT